MALLYPWATKEYLLWKMSIGQIIMYFNLGFEQKYGKSESNNGSPTLVGKSYADLKAFKNELIQQGYIDKEEKEHQALVIKQRYEDI
jgi:hypothetical protein